MKTSCLSALNEYPAKIILISSLFFLENRAVSSFDTSK